MVIFSNMVVFTKIRSSPTKMGPWRINGTSVSDVEEQKNLAIPYLYQMPHSPQLFSLYLHCSINLSPCFVGIVDCLCVALEDTHDLTGFMGRFPTTSRQPSTQRQTTIPRSPHHLLHVPFQAAGMKYYNAHATFLFCAFTD